MGWADVDVDNAIGQEAAKTMLALDYYLGSWSHDAGVDITSEDIVNFVDKSEEDMRK